MQMGAVVDEFDRDPLVLQQRRDRPGLTVLQRRHRVEEVRGDGGPRVDGLEGLLVRGVGVPDGGDHAEFGEQPHRVDPAGSSAASVTILPSRAPASTSLRTSAGSGSRSSALVVRALAAGRDERALVVDPGEVALLHQFRQQPGLPGQHVELAW